MAQVETVQQIYQEFGRGDIPAILSHLAEDVEWEYGNNSTDVPWLQLRRGRTHVAEFFQALADFEVRRFEPKTFLESGNVVVALIDVEATVRSTGRSIVEDDEVHVWYFERSGKVSRFRHRVDTHQQWQAWRPT
jgi:ketosteroid isomerase-like protein